MKKFLLFICSMGFMFFIAGNGCPKKTCVDYSDQPSCELQTKCEWNVATGGVCREKLTEAPIGSCKLHFAICATLSTVEPEEGKNPPCVEPPYPELCEIHPDGCRVQENLPSDLEEICTGFRTEENCDPKPLCKWEENIPE